MAIVEQTRLDYTDTVAKITKPSTPDDTEVILPKKSTTLMFRGMKTVSEYYVRPVVLSNGNKLTSKIDHTGRERWARFARNPKFKCY